MKETPFPRTRLSIESLNLSQVEAGEKRLQATDADNRFLLLIISE